MRPSDNCMLLSVIYFCWSIFVSGLLYSVTEQMISKLKTNSHSWCKYWWLLLLFKVNLWNNMTKFSGMYVHILTIINLHYFVLSPAERYTILRMWDFISYILRNFWMHRVGLAGMYSSMRIIWIVYFINIISDKIIVFQQNN